ncbi:hypothetical protein H6G93_10280 [Nostoc sp. FACHB-973]|uniref:Uncharacterized protein n=1 Tax=Desmonostoc muscorum LEGE 12446 TaxID=1828758 RepID=A0A8J7CZL4_DESMC|nr:hypothetical protein [Desmonostoc muscorum]MBD2515390.1 hypothetical protein [Nostoc sp. FACHB-973]MCF2145050.1 hypothetical protein [Desmonostoc muscorum LEGE 12446]
MTKPNFQAMTKQELRAYVLEHRDEQEAFYALVDKLREEPGIEITSMEQLHQLIEAKRDKADITDARAAIEKVSQIGTISLENLKRELRQ